jgi:PAS domain S-box-containing protein
LFFAIVEIEFTKVTKMPLPEFDQLLRLWWEQSKEHALIVLDPSGVISAWGGEATPMFGYLANEIVGQQSDVLFTPEDVEAGAPLKERQIADAGAPAEDDRWMRRRDGSRFWATGVLHALNGPDGETLGYIKILRNRTDLKEQLESHKREIRKLQLSDERKNRFIATLAHELRNPLGSLAMAAEILRLNPEDQESRQFAASAIERQVQFSTRLIEDLLDLTRLQKGKLRLSLAKLDLRPVVEQAADEVRPLIREKRQALHMILGPSSVEVMADGDRLKQVFVNLIQNAAKYTQEQGDIWIKLFLDGKEVTVKIEDNGIGISADVLPQIFDLFTQAEAGEEFAAGGLGIGLSLVKDLVRLHGGSIQVRSDGLGRGSEFAVRLPLTGAGESRPDDPSRD